jgi:hypothetical protein
MTTIEKLQWLISHCSDGVSLEGILLIGDFQTDWHTQITVRKGSHRFCFCEETAARAIETAYDHLNKP